jgi:hypothetical protein
MSMNFISFEIFSILVVIILMIKTKATTKIIEYSLKNVKVYLAPSDKDYELLVALKKNKEQGVNKIYLFTYLNNIF